MASNAVKIFDRIQTLPAEEQILATAASFILLCAASGVPAQDAFTAVTNLMKDPLHASGMDHRFAAMKMHIEDDLLN